LAHENPPTFFADARVLSIFFGEEFFIYVENANCKRRRNRKTSFERVNRNNLKFLKIFLMIESEIYLAKPISNEIPTL
jgi:hypothetical protein